jgi:hypothetical protein
MQDSEAYVTLCIMGHVHDHSKVYLKQAESVTVGEPPWASQTE